MVPGNAHEAPVLYELVENFVKQVGKGVIKLLILDRGFIDGKNLTRCKQEWGIDVLLPMKKNMDIWEDAWALAKQSPWQELAAPAPAPKPCPPERPEVLVRRELKRQKTLAARKANAPAPDPADVLERTEICPIKGFTSWSECAVPIHVLLLRETYADRHQDQWALMSTADFAEPRQPKDQYDWRTEIEERHRLLQVLLRPERFPLPLLQRDCRPSGVHFAELHSAPMATLETGSRKSGPARRPAFWGGNSIGVRNTWSSITTMPIPRCRW